MLNFIQKSIKEKIKTLSGSDDFSPLENLKISLLPIDLIILSSDKGDSKISSKERSYKTAKLSKISVLNSSGKLIFAENYTDIDVYSTPGSNIQVETAANSNVSVLNQAGTLTIHGGGKSLAVDTASLGLIDISNNSGITLEAKSAKDSIKLTSNGDVVVTDAPFLKGSATEF